MIKKKDARIAALVIQVILFFQCSFYLAVSIIVWEGPISIISLVLSLLMGGFIILIAASLSERKKDESEDN